MQPQSEHYLLHAVESLVTSYLKTPSSISVPTLYELGRKPLSSSNRNKELQLFENGAASEIIFQNSSPESNNLDEWQFIFSQLAIANQASNDEFEIYGLVLVIQSALNNDALLEILGYSRDGFAVQATSTLLFHEHSAEIIPSEFDIRSDISIAKFNPKIIALRKYFHVSLFPVPNEDEQHRSDDESLC